MKNTLLRLAPVAIAVISSMTLVGCGGGSNGSPPILDDDTGVVSTGLGCNTSATDNDCVQFILDYPVEGLDYQCSSNSSQVFRTQLAGNVVEGACESGDTVEFSIQADDVSNNKIEFGQHTLTTALNTTDTIILRIVDLAAGITGRQALDLSLDDKTIQLASDMVRLLQLIGVENGDHVAGDIQLVEITDATRNKLSDADQSVTNDDLEDGRWEPLVSPWLSLSSVTTDQANTVLTRLVNTSNAALYSIDVPLNVDESSLSPIFSNIIGLRGGSNTNHLFASNLILQDRQGYFIGTGAQWQFAKNGNENPLVVLNGKPVQNKLVVQQHVFNPISHQIESSNPGRILATDNASPIILRQGTIVDNKYLFGSEPTYRNSLANANEVNLSVLGQWQRNASSEQSSGIFSLSKFNTAAYLDNAVFKTENNVSAGSYYHFPLYATLTFNFDNSNAVPVDLGIVIDEFGDIRTDMASSQTSTNMSGQCGVVPDKSTMIDNYGVRQYRIGTIGGTNSSGTDRSITPRIILAGEQYGDLNGLTIGLNTAYLQNQTAGVSISIPNAKINIHNLLSANTATANAVNITDFENNVAKWVNIYNTLLSVYTGITENNATAAEKARAALNQGEVTISLPSCYSVNRK